MFEESKLRESKFFDTKDRTTKTAASSNRLKIE